MQSLLDYLTNLIGIDTFWKRFDSTNSFGYTYQWDYGAMLQYICCTVIIVVVIRCFFGFLRLFFNRR